MSEDIVSPALMRPLNSQRYVEMVEMPGCRIPSLHNIPDVQEEDLNDPTICSLHQIPFPGQREGNRPFIFQRSPLKIVRGMKQYLYDDNNIEFLDCVNSTAHVGHCHPQVISSGHDQMTKLSTAQGFMSDSLNKYRKELISSFPESLDVCYMSNSGSEANDLAIRLAHSHTGNQDIVVLEDSYFGNLGILVDISNKIHSQIPNFKKPDWVHILPLPDTYRIQEEQGWQEYVRNFEKSIDELEKKGRKLAAFILEPMFVIPGVHIPPVSCIQAMFRCIQSRGGLVIVDEVQTGLGRTGDHMWGFMHYEVVPDIVTIGKPMGNGYPMGGVICSQKLANSLGGYYSTFGGNPVSCSIGLSVLEIVNNEKLTTSAKMVGKFLKTEFQKLMISHTILGDFRGLGLLYSLEIVESKDSKTAAPELATEAMYGLKFHNVLVAITGRQKNILLITPPMCFNIENARRLCKNLDDVLRTIEQNLENQSVIVARPGTDVISGQRFKRSAEFEGNEESSIFKRSRVSESEDRYNDMD